ncbi:zinc finger domain-containing protein, partial [Streptomyces durocortorensis]
RPPVRVQERLYVYGRARRPCLRCGTPIRLADQDDRPTYWCPGCQSGPTP